VAGRTGQGAQAAEARGASLLSIGRSAYFLFKRDAAITEGGRFRVETLWPGAPGGGGPKARGDALLLDLGRERPLGTRKSRRGDHAPGRGGRPFALPPPPPPHPGTVLGPAGTCLRGGGEGCRNGGWKAARAGDRGSSRRATRPACCASPATWGHRTFSFLSDWASGIGTVVVRRHRRMGDLVNDGSGVRWGQRATVSKLAGSTEGGDG